MNPIINKKDLETTIDQIRNLAYSYIGLAAFIPILGQVILFIIVFILSVFGLFFYPLKKLFRKKMNKKKK